MTRVLCTCVLLLLVIFANAQCISDDPNSPACNTLISTDPRNNSAINNERVSRKNRFNWMTSTLNVYHPSGGYTGGVTGTPRNIVNPYHTIEPFLSGINYYNFPQNTRTPDRLDFYPEDGWELVHKGNGYKVDETTFVPTEEARIGPYFILYNRYTSLMRVVAGINNIGANQVIIASISHKAATSFDPNLKYSAIFSKYSEIISPLDQQTKIPNIEQGSPFPVGGDMFSTDFRMAYDPCICNNESTLNFSFRVKNTGDIFLGGRLIGTTVPLDGSGNSPLLNGRDFLTSVYKKGFDIKGGQLTYSNIDKLVEKYKQPQTDLFTKIALDLLGGILKAGAGPLDQILGKASTEILTSSFGGTSIAGFKLPDTLRVSFGAIGAATDQLSASLSSSNKIPSIGFIEAEMALSGTVTTNTDIPNSPIEISQPGSRGTNDSTKVLDRYYPAYNEALGTFALLETPSATRIQGFYDCFGVGDPGCKRFTYRFNNESLKYYFNPAAQVDEAKTRIYAAYEIKVPIDDSRVLTTGSLNYVSRTNGYDVFISDFYPIESLFRLAPAVQRKGLLNVVSNLRFQIFYEFLPNRYGVSKRHWEILTYPLTSENGSGLTTSSSLLKLPSVLTIGTTNYSTNTTIIASDRIVINGGITTAPGVTVTFKANDVSVTSSGSIPANASILIGVPNVFNDPRMGSVTATYVKTFCSSTGRYKAKEVDPVARIATNEEASNIPPLIEKETIAFPNPSTGLVSFRYSVDTPSHVKLNLINVTGSIVASIIDEFQEAGTYEKTYDLEYLPVGIYIYSLETNRGKENRRLVLIK